MTPPAGQGQRNVLKTHYDRIGEGPVAYLDETYHVETDGRRRFYVMAAVVVLEHDRDPLRRDLDTLVPNGWWHTTDELRSDEGRARTRDLLRAFQVPEETCVIVDKSPVDANDIDGTEARAEVLGRLLTAVHHAEQGTHLPVNLAIVEEHREARMNNLDRRVRTDLIAASAIAPIMALVAASPGSEHLLWLPDLACSAYRQKLLFGRADLFDEIEELSHVVVLS